MKRRYTALRILSVIMKVLGILALIASLGGAVLAYTTVQSLTTDSLQPIAAAAGSVLSGLLSLLVFWAIGQSIDVTLAIEENTRATSMLIQRLGRLMQDRLQ